MIASVLWTDRFPGSRPSRFDCISEVAIHPFVLTIFVGTSFFNGQATLEEMLRVIGFAFAPQVLSIFPCFGWIIGAIWSVIAGFIAVRQGLDLDNTNACLTIIVGFIVYAIGFFTLGLLGLGVGFML
jgi:hypothetical protein